MVLLMLQEMSNTARRIYDRMFRLKRPQSVKMLSGYFFLSNSAIYNALLDLKEMNCVEYIGRGQGWRVVRSPIKK